MFENILSIWKTGDFMSNVLEEFKVMLDCSETMFKKVSRRLIHNEGGPELRDEIYNLDKKVNELEKDIRKKVVEHLIMQPTVDVSACLVLMSVVKDAERLGDYCKNLYEVAGLLNEPLNKEQYNQLFNGIDEELVEFFAETKKAFIESDEEIAQESWQHKAKISQRCDDIIEQLAKSDVSTNVAVCLVLVARHYKRLASHLVNIATSVILPVSELDYYSETKKDDK